jgi:hypothetical protein
MIKSNIGGAIQRLGQGQRLAMMNLGDVFKSERWGKLLHDLAGITMELSDHLDADQKHHIPAILETFMHATRAGMMSFSIESIPIERLIRDVDTPDDFLGHEVHEELLRWVQEYKIRDTRDINRTTGAAKSDEIIAKRVGFAIQSDPEPWLASTNNNPEHPGLRYLIGLTDLPKEKISALLHEVLEAWKAYMLARLPIAALQQIRKSF